MRRISVVGSSGSGKSTLGRRLAESLAVPFIELDAINHQPGWAALDRDEFRARVRTIVAGDGWVIDGNYMAVQDLVWPAADTVVWLDLPRSVVMRRLAWRTVRRAVKREHLWNGNVEPLSNFYSWNPEHNVMRWAWVHHEGYVDRYSDAMIDPANHALEFVRLRTAAEVGDFSEAEHPSR